MKEKPTARLPSGFMARHLPHARGMTVFGQPLEDFSREQLMAIVVFACKETEAERAEMTRRTDFLCDLIGHAARV